MCKHQIKGAYRMEKKRSNQLNFPYQDNQYQNFLTLSRRAGISITNLKEDLLTLLNLTKYSTTSTSSQMLICSLASIDCL